MNRVLLAIAGALALYGCGGGGGGSSNVAENDLKIGKFIDSAVENVGYVTETQTGFTQQDGAFFYKEGEAVEFFIGKQSLGRTQAQSFVTPYELTVENANSPSELTAIRIGQILQSFDADGNPGNGIEIDSGIHQQFVAGQISFTDAQNIFEASFAGSLANSNAKLVNFNDAKAHLELVLQKTNYDYDKNCQIPTQTYRIQSVGNSEPTSIDTSNFDCASRHKVAYYAQRLQQVLVNDLNLNATSGEIITEAGSQEELYVGGDEYKKSDLGNLVQAIDVLVNATADSLNFIDSKTWADYSANTLKLALNAVSLIVKHDPNKPKNLKEKQYKEIKFATALIGVLADGANCGTGKSGSKFRSKACTDAVFSALKMIEPSVSLATTDQNALAVLEQIGALLDATSKIAGDPSKTRSALIGFASESTRILGNAVIKANVSDEAGLQTFLTEALDAVTKSTKGYFDCLKSADLKGCKDRVLNDTIEYLSKGVFRAGVIINLHRLEVQRDALYMTDYILQQYLLNKSDIYKVYAAYGIPIEYEKNCLIFVCLIDQDVINEREMFYKLVRKLSASNINSSWIKRESPYTADTWEKFNEYKILLDTISQSAWLDDAQLSMSVQIIPNANEVDFQVKTTARLSTFGCEAVGANSDAFGGPAGSAFKTKLSYSTPGLYTVACSGINENGEVVLKRKVSFTLSNCPTSAALKLGQCINFVKPSITSLNFTPATTDSPAKLTAAFSADMQSGYETAGNYVPKAGKEGYWPDLRTFVVEFESFAPSGTITLVASGFKSVSGQPMAADRVYTFPAGLDGTFKVGAISEAGKLFVAPDTASSCTFNASGVWDSTSAYTSSATGISPITSVPLYDTWNWRLFSAPFMSLIASHVNAGYVYIGNSARLNVTNNKNLYFVANDGIGAHFDNGGELTVSYSCQ